MRNYVALLLASILILTAPSSAKADFKGVVVSPSSTGELQTVVFTPANNVCGADESSSLQAVLNANKANNTKVKLRTGDCILLNSALTYPTGTGNNVVLDLNGAELRCPNTNKCINFTNTANAAGPYSVTALSTVTANDDDVVTRLTFASLPAEATKYRYLALVSDNMLLAEGTVNVATMTAANPLQFTTSRAAGFVNGDVVHIEYATFSAGTPLDDFDCTIGSSSGVTDTSFTCTGLDGSSMGTYDTTAKAGYATIVNPVSGSGDIGWLGQGSQVAIVNALSVDLVHQITHQDKYLDSPVVFFPDTTNKVTIMNGTIRAQGNVYDTGIITRNDMVSLSGFVDPVIKDVTIIDPWRFAFDLKGNFGDMVFDNLTCKGGYNNGSSSLPNCIVVGGTTYPFKASNIRVYGGRHGVTTYTAQGASYTNTRWAEFGYQVDAVFNGIQCIGVPSCGDTHEPTIRAKFNGLVATSAMQSGAGVSPASTCISDRGVDTVYNSPICTGYETAFSSIANAGSNAIDHGLPSMTTINNPVFKGMNEIDFALNMVDIDDFTGRRFPMDIVINDFYMNTAGRSFRTQGGNSTLYINGGYSERQDFAMDLDNDSKVRLSGDIVFNYEKSVDTNNTGFFMRDTSFLDGQAACVTIIRGSTTTKPLDIINEADTGGTKNWRLPCVKTINASALAALPITEAGATVLSEVTANSQTQLRNHDFISSTSNGSTIRTVGLRTWDFAPNTMAAAGYTNSASVGSLTSLALDGTRPVPRRVAFADGANILYSAIQWMPPASWNEGTISVRLCMAASATGSAVFRVQANAFGDGDSLDIAFPAATSQTITVGAANTVECNTISNITVGNTPADNDMVYVQIFRDPTDAADTSAGTFNLLNGSILYTTNTATD